jgi:hypothetical protein
MTATILGGLADASIRISLVAAVIGAVLWALRVRASAVRLRAWTAVVCAMLLMPALRLVVPAISIPVPTAITAPALGAGPAGLAEFATLKGSRDNEPLAPLNGSSQNDGRTQGARDNDALAAPLKGARDNSDGERYSSLALPAALLLYLAVASVLLARLLAGWRAARSVAAAGDAIVLAGVDGVRIRESRIVTTPMTIGVVTPVVLLPLAWRRWPEETLRAVLAHEMAHVRRRDGLVGVISRVNRSLFWFHPLAWWLDRALATTAEHASDDVALAATDGRGRYAEILIEMARTARRRGGRVSWQAVGMDGSGLLAERIDRVLRGEQSHDTSSIRKYTVAAGCVAAIVLAAACRPQASVPHPSAALEQRDHQLRLQLTRLLHDRVDGLRFDAIDDSSLDALESAVRQDPEDLAKLQRVLDAYWTNPVANPTESRRAHILWLIEHHPDSALAGSVESRLYPIDVKLPFPNDPRGYTMAKSAWLTQTNKPGASAGVLGNASYFLEVADKPLAEDMLIRARAMDPYGPWTARLGRFYALVLAGSDVLSGKDSSSRVSEAEPNSAFGSAVRRKLAESKDDALLTAAGWSLRNASWHRWNFDPDPRPWAEACFKRALQFNPDAILAHTELLDMTTSVSRNVQPLWGVPADSQYEYVSALPEAERFARLPDEANAAIAAMDVGGEWNDRNLSGYVSLAKDRAKKYADDILRLAPKYRDNPRYGMAIYAANMTLGSLALADGQTERAGEYLRSAAQAPRSEELTYLSGFAWGWQWHLPRQLVKQGVREPVALFLERIAEMNLADRPDLRQAAAAIRRGETPPFASY